VQAGYRPSVFIEDDLVSREKIEICELDQYVAEPNSANFGLTDPANAWVQIGFGGEAQRMVCRAADPREACTQRGDRVRYVALRTQRQILWAMTVGKGKLRTSPHAGMP
jgi:hypothetical protein